MATDNHIATPTVTMAMTTPTEVVAQAALYRLMTWLSPQFPIGSYTYSHGIEQAVEAGYVTNAASALAWIEDVASHGAGRSDAILLHHAHAAAMAADAARLAEVAELAAALQPSAELALESQSQGRAFLDTIAKSWDCTALVALASCWPGPHAYPIPVGVAAAGHGIPALLTVQAYLHAFSANLVSACVRLVPLGQTDGQRLIAALEPLVARIAIDAGRASLDDLGGAVALSDISSMRHEMQYTRLFRS